MKNLDTKTPRVYATRALIEEVEKGLFEMYRDVMIEEAKGQPEKHGKRIHITFMRECTKDEEADATTSRPDGTVILLRKLPRADEIEE